MDDYSVLMRHVMAVILFVLQWGCSASDKFPLASYITWEDMRVEEYVWNKLKMNEARTAVNERVVVPTDKPYISLIGNQSSDTVISSHTKASDRDPNGQETGTFNTATVDVESDYFCATEITIKNTIEAVPGGTGMQAVALRAAGNKSMFFKVKILGSQDTLLDLSGTHYFYQCYIRGCIDFIFGNARSLYKECVLHSTATESGAIAASHRNSAKENTGFSFLNCTVNGTGNVYLGRAWGNYSRVVYSYSDLSTIVDPLGWSDWGEPNRRRTVQFGEYKCSGRGADTKGRVTWSRQLRHEEAKPYLGMNFIDGDQWLRL
ncbi:hypothetical protein Sjap_002796 [Stephania japonica]|uniref:pectinesterase n=1 Tax=Stephania japonica TaxID=461633 RepID=A0AAP0KMI6_9MAGN